MARTPRLLLDHVIIRGVRANKRQSSNCSTECNTISEVLSNSADTLASCTDAFFDSYQICMNCLAATGISSFDANYFSSIKSSFDSLASSCNSLGKPITHTLTIPPISTPTTGSGSLITSGPPKVTPVTGTNTPKTSSPAVTDISDQNSSAPPIGAIVGGIIGGVAIIAGFIIALLFLKRRNKSRTTVDGAGLVPYGFVDDSNPPVGYVPTTQYGQLSGASMSQNFGQAGFVAGGAMYNNNGASYAPNLTESSGGFYKPAMPQVPFTSGPPTQDSHHMPKPLGSSHSSDPLIVSQQPHTANFAQPNDPIQGLPFDSPPAYDDNADIQPDTPSQVLGDASLSQASGSAPLSRAEVELISQRVASIINANGRTGDPTEKGKLATEQRKK